MPKAIPREDFFQMMQSKAQRRLPKRTGTKPKRGTLFAQRNKRLAIRESALRLMQCIITYRKTTANETKKYIVAPYSWRYRRLKAGFRKVLYAYDQKDKRTKSFVVRNIRNVVLTDRKYKPKWRVEIVSIMLCCALFLTL